jgi:D-tyrosyl-tRNA(Tyr) deacylase
MRCCVQRVLNCSVSIENKIFSEIGKGLLVFLGVEKDDSVKSCDWLANKICGLRIFENEKGKMSLDLNDINGELLIVSQFTLAGNVNKGKRPDFTNAMPPDIAKEMYDYFVKKCSNILGNNRVMTGIFAASMEIKLINDGPVTLIIEHYSEK